MNNNPNSYHNDNADDESPDYYYYGHADDESFWTLNIDSLSRGLRGIRLREEDEHRKFLAPSDYYSVIGNDEGCSSWQPHRYVPNGNGTGFFSRQAFLFVVMPRVSPMLDSNYGVAATMVDMMDKPYRIQKFFDLLDIQRYDVLERIVEIVTRDRTRLLELAKDATGVVSLKKLIETIKDVPSMCEHIANAFGVQGTFELMKHHIGSELVKHCSASLNSKDSMFSLLAATTYFVKLAKDSMGYKSLQFCIDRSNFQHRRFILIEAAKNCCFLVNDKYGNFVIQHVVTNYGNYVLNPGTTVTDYICREVGEHLVEFSTDRHGSYVIEKCLKSDGGRYLLKLLGNLDQNTLQRLIQDPSGNYVLQTALKLNKGSVFNNLLLRSISLLPREELLDDLYANRVMSMALRKRH